jgi:maleate cis-trans isomerase
LGGTGSFGSRARIGVISPTVLEVISADFYRIAPPGVAMVGVTCHMQGWSEDQYEKAHRVMEQSASYLGARKVDFLVHVATPPVVSRGTGFDLELIRRFEELAGCRATTSARAIVDAMQHLGVRRIALATAFTDTVIEQLTAYLAANGIAVLSVACMEASFDFLHAIPAEAIQAAARDAVAQATDAEAVLIPSGQIPAAPCVAGLEAELGIPVVAQNHSDFWVPFRALGITDVAPGHGLLLDSLRA